MEKTVVKKSALKTVANVLFWIVLVIVLAYSVTALFSEQDDNMTTVLGMSALTVQSNSMSPTFSEGDLIFIRDVEPEDIEVGDVITYIMTYTSDDEIYTFYNSHRVIQVVENPDGTLKFYTQGDNNPGPDSGSVFQTMVVGVWTGGHIGGFGSVLDGIIEFLKSPVGFFLFIVFPCFAFLVYEVFRFIKVMSEYNLQKALGDRVKMQEEALAMARAQLEAERVKEKENPTK